MRELAPNVWQLGGFPPNVFNVYLIGDVLIDAATRWAERRIVRQLGERKLSLLALTHVHPDHQGTAERILFREEDRVAIVGDLLNGMNLATTWPGLHEPPATSCSNASQNRHSIRRLAALQPRLICFGTDGSSDS